MTRKPYALPGHNHSNGDFPHGMLVRVSSISRDPEQAYRGQEAFIQAMLGALSPQSRVRLAGLPE